MADRDVKISIETTADPAPIDKTTKALDGVGEAAEKVNTKTGGADKALVKGSQSMRALGAASAASSGSMGGVTSALGQLAPKLAGIESALPVVGMATAAFVAWKKVIDTLADAAKDMRMALMAAMDESVANAQARSAKAYALMREDVDETTASVRMLAAAEAAAAEARSRERIAALEADRAKAKAALQPGDSIGARRIDADFDARMAGEESRSGADRRDRSNAARETEQASLRQTEADIVARMQHLQETIAAELERTGTLLGKSNEAMKKANDGIFGTAVAFYNPKAAYLDKRRQSAGAEYEPSLEDSSKNQERLIAELKSREKELKQVRNRNLELELGKTVAQSEENQAASVDTRRTYERQAVNASINIDEKKAQDEAAAAAAKARLDAERQSIRDQMDKVKSGIGPYDARVSHEQADVERAGSRLASRPAGRLGHYSAESNYSQQLKELQAAMAARASEAASITALLSKLRKQDEDLAAQIKRF